MPESAWFTRGSYRQNILHVLCNEIDDVIFFVNIIDNVPKNAWLHENSQGNTPLHDACLSQLPKGLLQLLLDATVKHKVIKNVLEETTNFGYTCLHCACDKNLSTDSLRLLVSFFPSNESFKLVLASKVHNRTPPDLALNDEHKKLLEDPNCWRNCRYWLFCNYRETFLNSLYPNSPEKTLEALKELHKNYTDDESLKKAVAEIEAKINSMLKG